LTGEPEPLGDILDRAVVRPGRRNRSLIARARRKWTSVAGEETARHSWPKRVRAGVLTVEVDSGALLAELAGYRREEILRGLNEGKDALGARQVKFVLAEDED
jgi:predicted nucleic acid-binding Zn ribbon protein